MGEADGACPVAACIGSLPTHLGERCRPVQSGKVASRARERLASPREPHNAPFVLYWMQTALRACENPALEVALMLARQLDCPLLVWGQLADRWKHATLRRHLFMLQGFQDVEAALAAQEIPCAFHLHRRGSRHQAQLALASRAVATITEEPYVEPFRSRTQVLARACSLAGTPLLCVESACVVPPRLLRSCPDRAWRYEKATKAMRHARLEAAWPAAPALPPHLRRLQLDSPPSAGEAADAAGSQPDPEAADGARIRLPVRPVSLRGRSDADLEALARTCEVDEEVTPVGHTRGGSGAASRRWRAFLGRRLATYGRTRNDALRRDGVSRMSAYQNLGMISPFRVARDAWRSKGAGAAKFLNEQQTWRELAYTLCYFRADDVPSMRALPRWARDTLAAHAVDPRPTEHSLAALAASETCDPMWNAMQTALRTTGELHNNLRMTWGKAVLQWAESPEQAIARLVHLNDHYALDGLSPPSYGGILWCFGLFDGPKTPDAAIYGTVRRRPTAGQARRFPPSKIEQAAEARSSESDVISLLGGGSQP